ncbi:MAG: protoporphyrinogen oxidase [Desulfuromonadaceae bacterium]|nr:protoporphyrinogen oxidase [Desulfuromonas sp.]MDY0185841.1 protoporphyrinogen oxidase [Desulfuromonadaceae bacterium]
MKKVVIAGAGLSGLSTAYALEQLAAEENLELEVTIVEKELRCGGKIWSIRDHGYLCEWGPNGFLDNKPATLELCGQLGLNEALQRSNDNARKRFVYVDKQLHQLPENALMFFRSGLLTWFGKMRLVGEIMVPKKKDTKDETLADFGRRRLGAEALNKLIAPMAGGIFAGDPETMSVKSCFPRIAELEQQYGGLLRAMLKLARKKRQEKKAGQQVASAAGPGGVLTSFDDGIQVLVDRLRTQIKARSLTGTAVRSIHPADGGRYRVELEDGSSLDADVVVSAVPAYAAATIFAELEPTAARLLAEIPYASMNVVCFGYSGADLDCDLNGFGYLIPRQEHCSVLGTLWDSSIFSCRVDEGKVLLRSMMGGATNPTAIDLSDEQVQILVQADLKRIMGITTPPEFVRIFRHKRAIPQYVVGHAQRLTEIKDALVDHRGIILTGNAYAGIGLNDCVANGRKAAGQAFDVLKG